jgi:hypothetical protein
MTLLILIGALLLGAVGILIALGAIPLFPEEKRKRPNPERRVAPPRDN